MSNTPRNELNVLIVSAQAAVRMNIKSFLAHKGQIVHTASSGQKAIIKDKSTLGNLIIADTSLPDMPVTEMLKKIRTYRDMMRDVVDNENPCVLLIAPASQELDNTALRELGVVARIHKPINLKTLGAYVEKVINGEFKLTEDDRTTIGILDPEPRARDYFEQTLQAEDVMITPMTSIFEAKASITGSRLDILLYEPMISTDDDPLKFIKELHNKSPMTKIIVCTAVHNIEMNEETRKIGVVAVMFKPINRIEIRSLVRELIANRK